MTGDRDKQRETLERLRAIVDQMRAGDPDVAVKLDAMIDEARTAIGGGPIQPHEHRSIVKRLSDAVAKYQASHPSLSANLSSLVDAVSEMGI